MAPKKIAEQGANMRVGMVDRDLDSISILRQCELLSISRSRLYYEPRPVKASELTLMHRIDELHTAHPFYGTRMMCAHLRREGLTINRKRVRRLMRTIGLESLAPGPNTSKPHPEHKVYPYLLRGLVIDRPNQVWATDITYVRMRFGFAYLCAVIDWFTRYVLSFRLSNTLEVRFCIEALESALQLGAPGIFNSDQGSQFTSPKFTKPLLERQIQISMDGKGRALDNIYVERLWRSVKYEEVYIKDYESMDDARVSLTHYFKYFNEIRPHRSLGGRSPAEIYFGASTRKENRGLLS